MNNDMPTIVRVVLLFILVNSFVFGVTAASTVVPSIINSDTTWTKSESPYELKGPVLVKNGVTLTIEPGTTVTLSGYYIEVNGTLSAVGTSTDKIFFTSGTINFPDHCVSWDEETGSGCIMENAELFGSKLAIGGSPKISNSQIYEMDIGSGSPIISGNTITGQFRVSGEPTIVNNYFTGSEPGTVSVTGSPTFLNNTINCRIVVTTGSPKFLDNTLLDGIHADSRGGHLTITGNNISYKNFGAILVIGAGATITNNDIQGSIEFRGAPSFHISDNVLTGSIQANGPGPLVIERNLVNGGIRVTVYSSIYSPFRNDTLLIQNNVIKGAVGIEFNHPSAVILNNTITSSTAFKFSDTPVGYFSPVIRYNNINSSGYTIKTEHSYDVDVPYNWWGTTDAQAINQTIYDLKYDFNLGTINFVPFLTDPNPEIPEFPAWIAFPLFLTATLVAIVARKRLARV